MLDCSYILQKKRQKKPDWVKQDAEKAAKDVLKKHLADVNNPKQVVMASRKKSLKNRIKAKLKSYFV